MSKKNLNLLVVGGTTTRRKQHKTHTKDLVDHFFDLESLNDCHIEDRMDYNSWIGCNHLIPGFGRLPEVF